MESKDIKDITETLADSLDNTQKNSTDTEMMVRQVLSLSDESGHTRIIDGILAHNTMSWENKVALIKEVYADYDIREENNTRRVMNMQSTQTCRCSDTMVGPKLGLGRRGRRNPNRRIHAWRPKNDSISNKVSADRLIQKKTPELWTAEFQGFSAHSDHGFPNSNTVR